ncbi:uncharacterized protein MKK02DRAFT_38245 [Dioszegia hungarica]|uniref:Protein SYM1 n=1 Tax=Dioszegia hungarica TaxID=4972 RepID=A0AA38H2R5_9TREE|nr:uncharacterized protein MKK02DRAFT_38245 [Dioszegia hungarica]KAI9633587.1 hypothetical protein MKK02DRAFT_38245 [Dioszegia hungarica]
MAGIFKAYTSLLARRPLAANVGTAAVLFATGDVIAQQLVEKRGSNHDLARTGRIVLWGGGLYAPFVTGWFNVLQRVQLGNKYATTAARVGLDQFLIAPTVLSAFFTVMTLLEGKDMNAVKEKWNADFVPTLKTNWTVWIPFQAINLGIIPPHLRVLAVNAVNVPWNTFLSLQAAKGKGDEVEVKVGDKVKVDVKKPLSV